MVMRAATVVQQLCKYCRTRFKFYCMFYFTCDRSIRDRSGIMLTVPPVCQIVSHRLRVRCLSACTRLSRTSYRLAQECALCMFFSGSLLALRYKIVVVLLTSGGIPMIYDIVTRLPPETRLQTHETTSYCSTVKC